jgi:hypothetical protein
LRIRDIIKNSVGGRRGGKLTQKIPPDFGGITPPYGKKMLVKFVKCRKLLSKVIKTFSSTDR